MSGASTEATRCIVAPPDLLEAGGTGHVEFDGGRVAVNVKPGTTRDVAFLFHGAIDRAKRPIPFFQPFLPDSPRLTQVAIFDATLEQDDDLTVAWYLGAAELPFPAILTALTREIAARLGCKRPIFVGGSSGGFAALHLATFHPGGIAVVANPQTNLLTYRNKVGSVDLYRRSLWPSAESLNELARKVTIDLATLYRKPGTNTVVYLQSAGDRKHVFTQMTPFISELHASRQALTTLVTGFWGKLGHSATIPYKEMARAVRTVHDHKAWAGDDFLQSGFFEASGPSRIEPARGALHDPRDLDVTDRIRAYLLRDA